MERLLAALAEQEVTGVHLEVAPNNRRAMGFYQHLGFARLTRIGEACSWGFACRLCHPTDRV